VNWVAILAGGSGTRFWPLSTASRPKQLLPLAGPVSTVVAAVEAVLPLIPRERLLLVTSQSLAGPLRHATGLRQENVLVEPRAASTAPALVWATAEAARRDPDAAILSMHADWHLGEPDRFRQAAAAALAAARDTDRLILTGMVPARPETGYGYLVPGEALTPSVWAVDQFVEKPDRSQAEALITRGALWNSGLFAWTAARLRAEVNAWTPEVRTALPALDRGDLAGFFTQVTPISIDQGLFERSDRVAMIRGEFAWDDAGNWEALARIREPDSRGNVAVGSVHLDDCERCIVWSEQTPMVLNGVRDIVVVEANGRILVMERSRAAELKNTLERLPLAVRDLP
jgi:mannose-1-phosphate guanylyltransferase